MVGMLPVPPIVTAFFLIVYAVAGLALGALSGWLVFLATECHPKKTRLDALLGLFGFMAGFIGAATMPWHENTITEHLAGGTTVTTTMNSYQHPERVAVILAILVPLLYELYRSRQVRLASNKASQN